MAGPMLERKSKLDVLVIEDNADFGANAVKGLHEHNVIVAGTLRHATAALSRNEFDVILSDAHFPHKEGEEPTMTVSHVLVLAFSNNMPVCFVTEGEYDGLVEVGDKNYISIQPVTPGDAAAIALKERKSTEKELFRKLGDLTSHIRLKKTCKEQHVWRIALEMATNAAANAPPFTLLASRKGAGIVYRKDGIIAIHPTKK